MQQVKFDMFLYITLFNKTEKSLSSFCDLKVDYSFAFSTVSLFVKW